jgi:dihydroneopterin aldolase
MTHCHLTINALELSIHLGWPTAERRALQRIFLDVEIRYPTPPKACQTDKLEDTVCYDSLIRTIKEKLNDRHFHLVEHLAKSIYDIIQTLLPTDANSRIRILKYPRIEGLTGGVHLSYGDF